MDDQLSLCLHKLEKQLTHLTTLTQLLDSELNALAAKKGDGLKELAREKLLLLNTIQKLDKELSGFDGGLFQQPEAKNVTTKIETLLHECKHKNEVNAHAAHLAHLSVRELKDILIGVPSSVTYGQDGAVVSRNDELVKNLKA
ncbi:flagellar export chaperone FlgN [Pseudoalteromonas byunsanensis]|uniref:Flagellar biogenesis protein n=1 Tax=Pseudoalteromonas byunsanensis TaxID=327939 RepID=A0A1S1N3S1_9GAMM|nr:flagellar export chaperone FlgN [Pseudoalteromonas byunsanensis]OHU95755.1 flagellar biogenesis protein [Pseudoalteromonas byunsanensis]